jgi:hypothetical protein
MTYWAISTLNAPEMQVFAHEIQQYITRERNRALFDAPK